MQFLSPGFAILKQARISRLTIHGILSNIQFSTSVVIPKVQEDDKKLQCCLIGGAAVK